MGELISRGQYDFDTGGYKYKWFLKTAHTKNDFPIVTFAPSSSGPDS